MSIKKLMILSTATAIAVVSTISFAGGPDVMPPVMPTVTGWTGFYGGLNIGGAGGAANTSTTFVNAPYDGLVGDYTPVFGVIGPTSLNASGAMLGAQVGYNYEFDSFVVGLESNFDYAPENGGGTTSEFVPSAGGNAEVTSIASFQSNYDFTTRARFGYAFADDRVLVYGTGGLAVADEIYSYEQDHYLEPPADSHVVAVNSALNDVNVGWSAGGGIEWMFKPNWSVQGQYLYEGFQAAPVTQTFSNIGTNTINQKVSYYQNVGTVAINYHF